MLFKLFNRLPNLLRLLTVITLRSLLKSRNTKL